jgi:uncharacterized protein involved in exopolysaccharide biosynthesis
MVRTHPNPTGQQGASPRTGGEESAEISIRDYWEVVRSRWVLILSATLVFGIAAGIYAFTAPPKYRIEVLLAPSGEDADIAMRALSGQLGALSGLMRLSPNLTSRNSTAAIATLLTPSFLRSFVEERDLLPILFKDRWNESTGAWSTGWFGSVPTLDTAYEKRTREVIDLRQDKDTGFWTLEVVWTDPGQAAEWATELVAEVNDHVRARDRVDAERAIKYLGDQADKTSNVGIRGAIFALIEAQMKKEMLARVKQDYALIVLGPAVVPSEENFVYPNRRLTIGFGLLGGMSLGVAAAFLLSRRGPHPNSG